MSCLPTSWRTQCAEPEDWPPPVARWLVPPPSYRSSWVRRCITAFLSQRPGITLDRSMSTSWAVELLHASCCHVKTRLRHVTSKVLQKLMMCNPIHLLDEYRCQSGSLENFGLTPGLVSSVYRCASHGVAWLKTRSCGRSCVIWKCLTGVFNGLIVASTWLY